MESLETSILSLSFLASLSHSKKYNVKQGFSMVLCRAGRFLRSWSSVGVEGNKKEEKDSISSPLTWINLLLSEIFLYFKLKKYFFLLKIKLENDLDASELSAYLS